MTKPLKPWLYRRGDGNEGNFPRCVVMLSDTDDPLAALRALVVNDYIPGHRVRRHIMRTICTGGDPEFHLYADVPEGPDGERAFDAYWITADLYPLTPDDHQYWGEYGLNIAPLRSILDNAALRFYRRSTRERPNPYMWNRWRLAS